MNTRIPGALGLAAVVVLAGAWGFRQEEASIPEIVERVGAAVVTLHSNRPVQPLSPVPSDQSGRRPWAWQRVLGSGVVVGSDGIILTNNHVVQHSRDLRVILSDRREFRATLVGTDPETDLAVLRIPAKGLTVAPIGDSSTLRVGETVLAIGNPLGVGQTVSRGIVSAKGRANLGIADIEDFLQTDAAINPGNSGGALVNLKGELVGINTAIATQRGGFEGVGFAIPSRMGRQVMEILLKDGRINRGRMGVAIQDMTPALARAMNDAPSKGALVADVFRDGPAEQAGLKAGDVVVKVDGEPVESAPQLRNLIVLRGAGARVTLDVWREKAIREITVRLGGDERKGPPSEPEGETEDEEGGDTGLAGVSVLPATPALLKRRGLAPDLAGLIVSAVDPGRGAGLSGLKEGDLILEVNAAPVRTVEQMRERIRENRDGVLLRVRRAEGSLFLVVQGTSDSP